MQLLTLMKEAEKLRSEMIPLCLPDNDRMVDLKFDDPKIYELFFRYHELLTQIEELGKRYHWSPTLRPFGLALRLRFTWSKKTEDERWENSAISWLFTHADIGGLAPSSVLRLRQCRQCNKWFYALTDHQLHCTAACRQKFHSHSPEFREKRRRYMREVYRPDVKEQELRSKSLARRTK